jgi:hypothetical protein
LALSRAPMASLASCSRPLVFCGTASGEPMPHRCRHGRCTAAALAQAPALPGHSQDSACASSAAACAHTRPPPLLSAPSQSRPAPACARALVRRVSGDHHAATPDAPSVDSSRCGDASSSTTSCSARQLSSTGLAMRYGMSPMSSMSGLVSASLAAAVRRAAHIAGCAG